MHLQKIEIPGVIQDIHRVLMDDGLFYFSVSLERPDVGAVGLDGKGRRFTVLTETDWSEICRSCGFRELRRGTSRDSAGRQGIAWGNFLFKKGGDWRLGVEIGWVAVNFYADLRYLPGG